MVSGFSNRVYVADSSSIGAMVTATLRDADIPVFNISQHLRDIDLESSVFYEDKECNDKERVVCKGTSTRRELKKLNNNTGYKARKQFWR